MNPELIFPVAMLALAAFAVTRRVRDMRMRQRTGQAGRREFWLFLVFLAVGLLGLVFDPFPKVR